MKKIFATLFSVVTMFTLLGQVSVHASTTVSTGTNWRWERGLNPSVPNFFSRHTHNTVPHGTAIVRSDGHRLRSGLVARGNLASVVMATNGPRTAAFHRFENRIPPNLLTLTLDEEFTDEQVDKILELELEVDMNSEVKNEHYYVYMNLGGNQSVSFIPETLHPDIMQTGFHIITEYNSDGLVEDDKMILIDEEGTYKEQIRNIVSRKNRSRSVLNSIDYEDVLNEIQMKLN